MGHLLPLLNKGSNINPLFNHIHHSFTKACIVYFYIGMGATHMMFDVIYWQSSLLINANYMSINH